MKNVIILGSGRSGTSMVAGTLSRAGYFMGDRLYPATVSNPKGYFEDPEINDINEELIAPLIPKRPRFMGNWLFRDRLSYGQRWLARLQLGTHVPTPPEIGRRIQALVQREPFCFKDPRFSYTLPVWRPYLKDTVFLCVFRQPTVTAASILKDCKDARYLRNLSITFGQALEVWRLTYLHILEAHMKEGEWLFLHYDQMFNHEGLNRIKELTGAEIDCAFPDAHLRRSASDRPTPLSSLDIYKRLCNLASYSERAEIT